MKVVDVHGKPLSEDEQRDWRYADSIGLRPSTIRFLNDKPFAVYKDGSGIHGPCPCAPDNFEKGSNDDNSSISSAK